MKDVDIIHVFKGVFFSEGVQYKYESSYNSRIVCHQVDDPTQVVQFSAYDTVQVTDEEAKEIKAFLIDVFMMERSSLASRKKDIKRLQEQGVESRMDHFLDVVLGPVPALDPKKISSVEPLDEEAVKAMGVEVEGSKILKVKEV